MVSVSIAAKWLLMDHSEMAAAMINSWGPLRRLVNNRSLPKWTWSMLNIPQVGIVSQPPDERTRFCEHLRDLNAKPHPILAEGDCILNKWDMKIHKDGDVTTLIFL